MTEKQLVKFLRDLADDLEKEKITDEKKKIIGEFYLDFTFSQEENILKNKDIYKYLTMGWFVYNNLK